jgi:two-component system, OmpR family, sensor kinase
MTRDRAGSASRAWLAITCSRDGQIMHVLRDDFGIVRTDRTHLSDVVDSGSAAKSAHLLAAVQERGCVAGWYLNVPAFGGAIPLFFAGASAGDSLLIVAAAGAGEIAEVLDELGIDEATRDALHSALDDRQPERLAARKRENDVYEELSRLNNELINRERELARKSAALERLSAEKSRLLAIAAHDLRNPLTVVASYADLLRIDGAVSGEHLLYVEEISRTARFMAEMVEELLDTARLESGHADLDLQELNLVNAARHAATINRMRADRKQITIEFESEETQAIVRADPVKLRQIINNLVVNAIKFSPAGTIVTVRALRRDDQAIVEIADQGVGIPPEKLAWIFEPFATLASSGTAGEKSTGLGLAIVKQLAEMHDANVEVVSREGEGSLFRVAFPLLR